MTDLKLHNNARRARLFSYTLSSVLLYVPAVMAAQDTDVQGCPVAPPELTLPAEGELSNLVADQAILENDIATARGDALFKHKGQTLAADYVRYNRKTSEIVAHGGLEYLRSDLHLTASRGNLNVDRHIGNFQDTHYTVLTNGARGDADLVDSLGDNRYKLKKADYSTCVGPTKAWMLSARHIDLDREKGRGVARDATLRIYGIPVLYTPYFDFPIDNRRHSGFLVPTVGGSGRRGFEVRVPYYFNLAPNYDATVEPHIMAKRGFQIGGEFRHRLKHHKTEVAGEFMPYDAHYNSERDMQHFEHVGKLSRHFGIEANYSRVSDKEYFEDLSNNLSNLSTSHLDRSLELTAAKSSWLDASLLTQDFQSLNRHFIGLGGRFDKDPYQRLPQATLNVLSPTAPFQVGLDAQYTRFRRSDSVDADRTDVHPRLLWGIDRGGWFLNSEAGYRYTHYDLRDLKDADNDYYIRPDKSHIDRHIPSFEANAGLRFTRTMANDWVQTLEPRIQYRFVDYENQEDIPIFDSGNVTMNYDQLFAKNRFTGIDRIGDANQMTLGLTSNFISPDTGRTVGRFELGRITSFRNMRVDMPNSGATGYSRRGSDYVVGGMFSPNDFFSGQTSLAYDAHKSRIDRAVASTTFTPGNGYRLNLSYRYYRDYRPARDLSGHGRHTETRLRPGQYETLSQVGIGFLAPITSKVRLIGGWNYSFNHSQNIETLAGVEFHPSCCYSARIAWRRYISGRDGRMDNAVMFQFVLRGLGQFGQNISSFVDQDLFSEDPKARSTSTFNTMQSR